MRGKANEGRTLAFGTAGSGLVDDFGGRASENGTGLFGADQPAGRALAAHARGVADGLLALGQPPAVEDTICSETDREKGKQSIDLVMAASGNDGRGRGGGLVGGGGPPTGAGLHFSATHRIFLLSIYIYFFFCRAPSPKKTHKIIIKQRERGRLNCRRRTVFFWFLNRKYAAEFRRPPAVGGPTWRSRNFCSRVRKIFPFCVR